MSLIDSLNFLGRQHAGTSFGDPPPADVSDREADRWHDDGAGFLEDALSALGLRRTWTTGRATEGQKRGIVSHLVVTGRDSLRKATTGLVDGLSTLAGWYRSMKAN